MELHNAGVKVFSIGVTNSINRQELAALSSPPHLENENWFTTPNFDALSSIVDVLTVKTCGMYGSISISEWKCHICFLS